MTLLHRNKFEVVAFERERIVRRPVAASCPVCGQASELLTTRQAATLLQVSAPSVRRWLAQGLAHGVRTPGGQYRVCRSSLFWWAAEARP
jgi:excisionase family DNA binding protein